MAKKVYNCRHCDKEYKSRGSCWKHEQKCDLNTDNTTVVEPSEQVASPVSPPVADTSGSDSVEETATTTSSTEPEWFSFDMGFDDTITETMPQPLKMLAKPPSKQAGKKTKAQLKAEADLNIQLLKSTLTIGDSLLTRYGRAVIMDEDFSVKHSEGDKDMVAEAQWRYLESKGVIPSNVVNEGLIAAGMTAWYFGKPVMEIRKKSKVPLLKGVGKRVSFLGRLPLIGRLFKRRKKQDPAQTTIPSFVNDATIHLEDSE